eukprot:4078729-Pyramimonas_sp.AAC.1
MAEQGLLVHDLNVPRRCSIWHGWVIPSCRGDFCNCTCVQLQLFFRSDWLDYRTLNAGPRSLEPADR